MEKDGDFLQLDLELLEPNRPATEWRRHEKKSIVVGAREKNMKEHLGKSKTEARGGGARGWSCGSFNELLLSKQLL